MKSLHTNPQTTVSHGYPHPWSTPHEAFAVSEAGKPSSHLATLIGQGESVDVLVANEPGIASLYRVS